MRFKGKVSWWFYAIMIGVAALMIPLIRISAVVDPNTAALIVTSVIFVAVELFSISVVAHNFVELQNEVLLIVFGPIKTKIPYSDIAALLLTNNSSSSLAASLDRIEIKCKHGSNTMISIIEKERFFREIQKYNAHITVM